MYPAGVDNYRVEGVHGLVDVVHERSLRVALPEVHIQAETRGGLVAHGLEVLQGGGAVDRGLATAEQVEVRTVQQKHP